MNCVMGRPESLVGRPSKAAKGQYVENTLENTNFPQELTNLPIFPEQKHKVSHLRLLMRSALDDPEDLQAMVKVTACTRKNGCVTDSKLELAAFVVIPNARDSREIDHSFAAM